ncbi:hypothetical protein SLA2020_368280 [Shorea laevis]
MGLARPRVIAKFASCTRTNLWSSPAHSLSSFPAGPAPRSIYQPSAYITVFSCKGRTAVLPFARVGFSPPATLFRYRLIDF